MERNIIVNRGNYTPVKELEVEIVERKGLGHPDTLIDGIMENISVELCNEYLEKLGKIMHHNVDKGQIVGGKAHAEFGKGDVIDPIYVLLSGRATYEANGIKFNVKEIAERTAKEYLQKSVRNLDVEKDVIIESKIKPGSKDLVDLFLRQEGKPQSNDTSFGVGFAPFSVLETTVMQVEKYLNSDEYKKSRPYVGEDIKVMGLREGSEIKLTVAMAFVAKYVQSIGQYEKQKETVKEDIEKKIKQITNLECEVFLNTADDIKNNSIYITATGTSSEAGDDGSVGRGNRSNGLITPLRLMTLEACAGKNPVNHVGKIYSVLASKMANEIYSEIKENEIDDVSISLLSQIGKPIDEPKVAFIELVGKGAEKSFSKARYIADKNLEEIESLTMEIVKRKHPVFW